MAPLDARRALSEALLLSPRLTEADRDELLPQIRDALAGHGGAVPVAGYVLPDHAVLPRVRELLAEAVPT